MPVKQLHRPLGEAARGWLEKDEVLDPNPPGINFSQLQEFNRCRYRWHLRTVRGIDRRSIAGPMDLGTAIHAGMQYGTMAYAARQGRIFSKKRFKAILEHANRGIEQSQLDWIRPRGKINEEAQQALQDIDTKARAIVARALEEFDLPKWEIVRVEGIPLIERRIFVPCLPGLPFHGRQDLVAKHRADGLTWVIDYKSREAFTDPELEEVDLQAGIYQYLLQSIGVPTAGSIKFQIRSRVPELPKVNKNGSISRHQIMTTWETYAKFCVRHKQNPNDYLDMKEKLSGVEFFRTDRVYRNQTTINAMWQDIVVPMAKVMSKAKSVYRNMNTFNCRGCWAKEFCLADLVDGDTAFLLHADYVDTKASPEEQVSFLPTDLEVDV